MSEHLDEAGVDQDAGRDRVEDADAEKRGARVGVVSRVHTDADRDADGSDELRMRRPDSVSAGAQGRKTAKEQGTEGDRAG